MLAVLLLPGCDHDGALAAIEDGFSAVETTAIEPDCVGCVACPPSGVVGADAGSIPEIVSVDVGSSSPSFSTRALQLNGVSEFARLGDLMFHTGSISMWIRTSGDGFLFSKANPGGPTTGELRLSLYMGRLRFDIDASERGGLETGSKFGVSLSDDRWHHALVTFNPGMKMFIDGQEQPGFAEATANLTGMTLSGVDVELGRNNAHPEADKDYYAGMIDEVAIFDRALDAGEVSLIYNGGVPGDLLGPSVIPALRHWWRLGEGDTPPVAKDSVGSVHGRLMSATSQSCATN